MCSVYEQTWKFTITGWPHLTIIHKLMFIIVPINEDVISIKSILKFLRQVSFLLHHPQGAYNLCQIPEGG